MRKSTLFFLGALVFSCGDSDSSDTTSSTDTDAGTTDTDSGTASNDAATDSGVTFVSHCGTASTSIENIVCAANEFIATLSDTEKASTVYDASNAKAKTLWSNLPGVTRNGVKFSALNVNSRAAALVVAKLTLSTQGYQHMTGVLAADDYLNSQGGGMGGGGAGGLTYGSGNYSIAFIGTPSTTGDFIIQIGGHHMAYNITYKAGVGYPTPHHLGAEPKASFTVTGDYAGTYQPLGDKGTAMKAMFTDFTTQQLTDSYLSGQTFADVLLGPVEYSTGSYSNVTFPTPAGVLVSSLTQEQQDRVTAAVKTWIDDYDTTTASSLLTAYTSAYDQTYISYAGPTEGTIDFDVNTTYVRVDGPRLWLELVCQNGVVIRGLTHFHTIYRDKTNDYGGSL